MHPENPAGRQPVLPAEKVLAAEVEQQVGLRNFDHWFRDKTTLTVSSDELTVGVGSPFLLSWMQKQFRKPILAAAEAALGPSARVRFDVDASISLTHDPGDRPQSATDPKTSGKTPQAGHKPPSDNAKPADRNGRRFADLADFIKGPSNELALTAAQQVCQSPGAKFNPLFLYGGVGLGKTHLLEGVYRSLRRRFPSLKVMFLTAEAFANYFTQGLREHTLPSFRQRFRTVDVLLVDDIDFLDSKRVIQEEFLHTFKQLASHGRQLVLTADRHPRLLSNLSEELTTRFLSGLVCRVEIPDFETRRQIVVRKAKRLDAEISSEALSFVARRFKNNVRELEGALNCLETFHSMTKTRVSLSTARQVLADLERDCIRIVRMSDVEQTVCGFFGLQTKDLKSSRRHRSVSQPRMLAMYLVRKHTSAAYSEIGRYFGGRNHSTVMSAEKKVREWIEQGTPITVASETWPMEDVLETLEQQLRAS